MRLALGLTAVLAAGLTAGPVLLLTACGPPSQEAAAPGMPPPDGSPALPPDLELPRHDVRLSVPEAYGAIPQRRTAFDFEASRIPEQEREYLRVMFYLLEQATRLRVVGFEDLTEHSVSEAEPAARLDEMLELIDRIEPPESLAEYHQVIRLALDEQQRVFEDWEIQREGFRHRRRIGMDPRIKGSSVFLNQAYRGLMERYGETEPEANRRAFEDLHRAMDFIPEGAPGTHYSTEP